MLLEIAVLDEEDVDQHPSLRMFWRTTKSPSAIRFVSMVVTSVIGAGRTFVKK